MSSVFRSVCRTVRSMRQTRRGAAAVLLAAVAALSACDGGSPITPFVPTRVLAFGDESSVIDSAGRKYTVNALDSTATTIDCATNLIWIQVVATSRYGLVFPECNPNNVANPASRILATPGAKVADLAQQIDRQLAAGPLTARDLVTVMVGANDLIDLYRTYPTNNVDALIAESDRLGQELGRQVNRLVDSGARVLVATVFNLAATPFGRAEKASDTTFDRGALLAAMVQNFNASLRTTIVNDGRRLGIVLADALFDNYLRLPALGGFVNVSDPVCAPTALAPNCNSGTVGPADAAGNPPSSANWLWADPFRLSPAGHAQLGTAAASRASNNPFGS